MQIKTIKKIKLSILILAILIGLFATMKETEAAETKKVKISVGNFPDAQLRTTIEKFDKNKDGYLSEQERNKVTSITINKVKISGNLSNPSEKDNPTPEDIITSEKQQLELRTFDCKGLRYFKKLRKLKIVSERQYNQKNKEFYPSEIYHSNEISSLTKLEKLTIKNADNLTKIKLNKCKKLKSLTLDRTGIKKLDISALTSLNNLTIEKQVKIKKNSKQQVKIKKLKNK